MSDPKNQSWHDLYREAVMESDPEKVGARIARAHRAIRGRITELRSEKAATHGEQARLDCASHCLHLLQGISEKNPRRPSRNTAAA